MAEVRHGVISWPGIISPTSLNGTLSRGVSPASFTLKCLPQPGRSFASEGDLTFTDGVETVRLRNCKADLLRERRDISSGVEWEIQIYDRRWKWRDTGYVSLFANQMDPHSKFVPWTVRSLREIAVYCLEAMGERDYFIDLPVGLTSQDAAGIKEFLESGINFPPSGINPPVNWFYEKPAQVLEQLCEMFGRYVVWQWKTDSVAIVRKGNGSQPPAGSIFSRSPSLNDPEVPDGVMVVGAPTRYQADIPVQAVGVDWNGLVKPINDLSYAPQGQGVIHRVEVSGTYQASVAYQVSIDGTKFSVGPGGVANIQDACDQLEDAINASPEFNKVLVAAAGVNKLTIRSKTQGPRFDVIAEAQVIGAPTDPPTKQPRWVAAIIKVGERPGGTWAKSPPPLFPGIRATPQLTIGAARDLARKCVFRWYQVSGVDASGKGRIKIPGYGEIVRRQQLVLLDTMCEQVVPEAPDFNVRLRDGSPLLQNVYDGFSRDKPARCIGAVAKRTASHLYFIADRGSGLNTEPEDIVQADFGVDNTFQLIKFGNQVFKWGPQMTMQEPSLRLRTAVNVRDAQSNSMVAYVKFAHFPGKSGNQYAVQKHEDVQVNVIPEYRNGKAVRVQLLEADPILRASYYLAGMIIQYRVEPSIVNEYNGLVAPELDGVISQISWRIDTRSGCETTVSANYEHDTAIPPYPARRRLENLRAAVGPGGFLGQVGDRTDPTKIPPFNAKK